MCWRFTHQRLSQENATPGEQWSGFLRLLRLDDNRPRAKLICGTVALNGRDHSRPSLFPGSQSRANRVFL
jgi:hypothetical protein